MVAPFFCRQYEGIRKAPPFLWELSADSIMAKPGKFYWSFGNGTAARDFFCRVATGGQYRPGHGSSRIFPVSVPAF